MDRILLTVREACEAAAISKTAGYDLVRSGEWASIRIGRSRRVLAQDLRDWIAQKAEANAQELNLGRVGR